MYLYSILLSEELKYCFKNICTLELNGRLLYAVKAHMIPESWPHYLSPESMLQYAIMMATGGGEGLGQGGIVLLLSCGNATPLGKFVVTS